MKQKFIALLLCLGFGIPLSYGQVDYNQVAELSSTYLIKNASVYHPDRGMQKNTSILIQNGTIISVGQNIKAPFDAQIILADSLYAYPAFIDGLSHKGIVTEKEQEKKNEKIKFPGLPTDKQAGITPGNSVKYNATDKTLTEYRKAGFAVAHIVPDGKMLPGQGSTCLLSADPNADAYLKENHSLFSQFKTQRGVYPSTIIGVISKWKDIYRKASYKQTHASKYSSNQTSQRPQFSTTEKAMLDVVNKKKDVFFVAEKHKDIARVIQLKKELGFNAVLVDVKQGWMALDKIRNQRLSVLLSLDLPEDKSDDKKEDEEKLSDEQKDFNKKKAVSLESYLSQAASFEKANMLVGFTTRSAKVKDVHKALRTMNENGASERYLLNALTKNNAKLLGIDKQVGSITSGMMANLFLSTKPYFDEKSKIQFTFIEGVKHEFDVKEIEKPKGENSGDPAMILGEWSYVVQIEGDPETGTFEVSKDGDSYTVQLIDAEGTNMPGYDITVDGSNLSFSIDVEVDQGQTMKVDISANFTTDEVNGHADAGPMGSFPLNGKLISKPE